MGMYTVKSAYTALQVDRHDRNLSDNSGFWRVIWNLKIPQKTKIFLWRALSESLPTKELRVCEVSGYGIDLQSSEEYVQWMGEVIRRYTREEIAHICMICWQLWKNRNDIVWNQKSMEPSDIVKAAELFLNQWRSAQDKSFDNYLGFMTQADGKEHWERPQIGKIKINTDAAIFEESSRYSYSMIACDHSGELIEAAVQCKRGCLDPEMAEAFGIKEALSWAKNKAYSDVIVELDCLALIQAIRSNSVTLSYLGRVIQDCKSLLVSLKERNVSLIFVKRSANKVAHFIARTSSSLAERRWKRGMPI